MRPEAGPGYRIRGATLHDAVFLSELGRRTFLAAFGAANHPDDLTQYLDATYSPQRQRAELGDPLSRVLIALDGEREAGFVKLRRGTRGDGVTGAEPIEIQRLYADLPWLGRGVGSFLLAATIDRAAREGHDSIWLAVWEHNPAARRLYERHGFRVVGQQLFILGKDRQQDLVMERR